MSSASILGVRVRDEEANSGQYAPVQLRLSPHFSLGLVPKNTLPDEKYKIPGLQAGVMSDFGMGTATRLFSAREHFGKRLRQNAQP